MSFHRRAKKFGRKRDQRKALLKILVVNLLTYKRIKTTLEKAKEMRSLAEKLIHRGKRKDLSSIRYLQKYLPKSLIKEVTEKISPLYQDRNGGYTRIIKLGHRLGDGAKVAFIELVDFNKLVDLKEKNEKAKSAKKSRK